ncbi:MAG: ABC transporter permease [Muribaculaceae bacterium]|nr:ABC transporter permease [Muribaculaceae bacterium]
MVWKLLRKNISVGQIIGYSLASLIGMAIVISAVKFYADVNTALNDEDSFISKDYIIISKPVSAAGTIGLGGGATFSKGEIAEIKAQPWTRDVGEFTAADFNVEAAINLGGHGMATHLFFESIPDKFFDIKSDDWTFEAPDSYYPASNADDIEIPIVMSKDYLTLYNFGYATGRGMPQLTEGLIKSIPITFYLSGNGHRDRYRGRIVGFSSRLNTIAVPENFITWANKRYAPYSDTKPSRLIIEANTPGDPAINQFLEAHGYEVAGDKADNGKANYFLTVATTIVITVGVIITLLAFFILMLSIYLLLQKNRRKLQDLMLLGYSPWQVSRPYAKLIVAINATVLCLAVAVMMLASGYWTTRFDAIGITGASPWSAIIVGLIISATVSLLNIAAICRIVRRNFYIT